MFLCEHVDHNFIFYLVGNANNYELLCSTTVPLVELTLPEHPSSPPVSSGVRVARSVVLYICFLDRYLSFCTFSFGDCVVCSSSIYIF